ncbi:MAG TPA: hypothetical protein VMV83_10560 [Rectinemataceae bacterium]|nr:hypothetical protein [Rectinemataceae bacterium]
MKRTMVVAAAMLFAGMGASAADEGCITCHGDAAMMKALYQPPSVAATEAEG